jgi:hypothetical protein
MNIADKQRLWSKYYILNEYKNNYSSLIRFVDGEVKLLKLNKKDEANKRRKIIRYMLKMLPKKIIIEYYYRNISAEQKKQLSKNEIITKMTKRLI